MQLRSGTMTANTGNGVKRFRKVGNSVLKKIMKLRDCKREVKEAILELTDHATNLTSVLKRLDKNIQKMETRRKFLHTSGVAATTLGSSLAAVLWAIAYVNEEEDGYCTPLAWLATGVGVGGTVVKMGTAYVCSSSNQSYMKELEDSMSSRDGKQLSAAEDTLRSKFKEMIQLLHELYGGGEDRGINKRASHSSEHPLLHHSPAKTGTITKDSLTPNSDEEEVAPLVITLMETADTAGCAPDVISTVLEYSTDFGLESMEVIEQTYDAATASLGEVISYGILEGAANGLAVVLSSYEIYKLIGSWNKENPTSQKIEELITNVQKKYTVYTNLKKCIEIVDTFLRLRTNVGNRN